MLRYIFRQRLYKTYIVLPLLIYSWIMYLMLEQSCNKQRTSDENRLTLKRLTDHTGRKIMQLLNNQTETLFYNVVMNYRSIDQQKKELLNFLQTDELKFADQINKIRPEYEVSSTSKWPKRDMLKIGETNNYINRPLYLINCSNIHEVHLISKIGHGVSKQTFKADFKGMPVAVKMVTRHQREVKSCIEKINENHPKKGELRSKCYVFPTMKLMKEILLLEQISHPGFAQLLGYCVRNEESETTDLTERGIVSVFELGERAMFYNVQTLTWQQRLTLATELSDFLNYLEHSPLGSLRVRDFKEDHFLMINKSLKMIDLDDVDNLEPACHMYVSADSQAELAKYGKLNGCEFGLACQQGLCIGFNAKQNMKFMNRLFFKKLLFPTVFPKVISPEIGTLLAHIDSNELTAAGLTQKLLEMNKH